ncbi:hypothetical protein D7V82_16480 [bacterium 1xD8-6]|nr:hypothetical protein D7V72_17860 [bacterium D16-36]RKI65443.1 hypothetical protein D7V82_16480 [bacterium 1xD8-6]
MSMLGINSALVGMYQFVASKGIAETERADTTETSFINQLKETGGTAGTSRVDAYTEYLRSKYGNVRIQNVGKDQQSLDKIGKSMSGSDVVIAPNILEQMANDTKKAVYYEGKIDDFFNATPMLKASFAAQGLDYQPCGVVIHEDGSVTYIGGCADSPERVAEVNAINKAKREKEAARRKANMERSREAAEEQKRQMDIAYQKKSMAEFFANRAIDINRITYTASPEFMGSAIAAYEKNIMEVAGSLNR